MDTPRVKNNFTKTQTSKFKRLERNLQQELKKNLDQAKSEDTKAQVELQKMFTKQVDKRYLMNQRKRVYLEHQTNKRFYAITNSMKSSKQEMYESAEKSKIKPKYIGVSLPNLKNIPDKYRDLIDAIKANENSKDLQRVPTIYLSKDSHLEISKSLQTTLKHYKMPTKQPPGIFLQKDSLPRKNKTDTFIKMQEYSSVQRINSNDDLFNSDIIPKNTALSYNTAKVSPKKNKRKTRILYPQHDDKLFFKRLLQKEK